MTTFEKQLQFPPFESETIHGITIKEHERLMEDYKAKVKEAIDIIMPDVPDDSTSSYMKINRALKKELGL
jgi:hypothetical protein